MSIDAKQLLERFLRYVRMDSTSDPTSDRYPSSLGQWELGRVLVAELQELGLSDAKQDEHGLITATVPGTVSDAPVVVLNSHLDTSPEMPGANVQPQVIDRYSGGAIRLPGAADQRITEEENPELAELRGRTLITTDGTTLLGADDKAGVAIIMQAAATLLAHPDLPRGDVRILFTCDEEIGRGVQHVDVAGLRAAVCYTLDGPGHGQIDVETFSADLATVVVQGKNIHPAIAKDRMVNSIRATADFIQRLPRDTLAPEVTAGRQGFLHPYDLHAAVERSELRILLRDFETEKLSEQSELLRKLAREVEADHPGCQVELTVTSQYRNLGDGLRQEPRAVAYAEQAYQRLGKSCQRTIIRGGTDGSQLTALGLPTPNLSSGQHNPHSPREFACLEEMVESVEVLIALLGIWATS